MTARLRHVLFLETRNAARSIVAEALTNASGRDRLVAFSAGTVSTSSMDGLVLEVLRRMGTSTAGLRSKSVAEFDRPDAPPLDAVIALCPAKERSPVWPGHAITDRWIVADPEIVGGSLEQRLNALWAAALAIAHEVERLTGVVPDRANPIERDDPQ